MWPSLRGSAVQFKWNGAQVKKDFAAARDRALLRSAIVIEGKAVNLVPVDQGNLQDSITYVISGKAEDFPQAVKNGETFTLQAGQSIKAKDGQAIIGTVVFYAPYQEFGAPRRNVKAQPFLLPAYRKSFPAIKRFFKEEIGGVKWVQ